LLEGSEVRFAVRAPFEVLPDGATFGGVNRLVQIVTDKPIYLFALHD
jgi:hypothetical protein